MNDCVFCRIVAGHLPAYKVYEDAYTTAFLDIHPVAAGHTLVVPKRHARNIFDISPGDWANMQETARKVAGAIEQATDAHGINLMMNNREHAGQIVEHAHVHLIPRFKGDGLTLWPHGAYKKGEAEAVAEKIRSVLA